MLRRFGTEGEGGDRLGTANAGKILFEPPTNTGSCAVVRGFRAIGEVEIELHCGDCGLSNEGEAAAVGRAQSGAAAPHYKTLPRSTETDSFPRTANVLNALLP